MKKLIAITLTALLALSLVACGSGKIKDGTYSAENKNAVNGWKDTLSVTYKDGAVVDAKYDAKKDDGSKKSEMSDEEYGMTDPNPTLSTWMPLINENVVKANGDAAKIEAVAGASASSDAAKALMGEIAKKAKAGDTATAVIDNATK